MTWTNKGVTHRSTIMGTRGMVASAHPLSSLAGVQMLQQGGSAVDAIVAMCAALNVVEPYMSGLGGGGAMIIHPAGGETQTLFYGGAFPANANVDTLDYGHRRYRSAGQHSTGCGDGLVCSTRKIRRSQTRNIACASNRICPRWSGIDRQEQRIL